MPNSWTFCFIRQISSSVQSLKDSFVKNPGYFWSMSRLIVGLDRDWKVFSLLSSSFIRLLMYSSAWTDDTTMEHSWREYSLWRLADNQLKEPSISVWLSMANDLLWIPLLQWGLRHFLLICSVPLRHGWATDWFSYHNLETNRCRLWHPLLVVPCGVSAEPTGRFLWRG